MIGNPNKQQEDHAVEIKFAFKAETKTCYRFETGERPDLMTLYLKKEQIDKAGIDPRKGIVATITQQK
jgi:hypothetical protein